MDKTSTVWYIEYWSNKDRRHSGMTTDIFNKEDAENRYVEISKLHMYDCVRLIECITRIKILREKKSA